MYVKMYCKMQIIHSTHIVYHLQTLVVIDKEYDVKKEIAWSKLYEENQAVTQVL